MTPTEEELARLKEMAIRAGGAEDECADVFEFNMEANPATVLALIERIERLEAALGLIRIMSPDEASYAAPKTASLALRGDE